MRRTALSRALLVLGALAEIVALVLFVIYITRPTHGLESLEWIVSALVVAGLASIPIAGAVWLAPQPRALLVLAGLACTFSLMLGVAFFTSGVEGAPYWGAASTLGALGGLAGVARRWRR